jgi:adenosylhomocysteine nucleosidase
LDLLVVALKNEFQHPNKPDQLEIVYTGVGKINAAFTLTYAITEIKPTRVINFGTAGAITPNLKGLVTVTGFIERDMDATGQGLRLGQTPFEEDILIGEEGIVCGTGDSFVTSPPKISCDLVDMEGYALAKVCKYMNISFQSYKYISDRADSTASEDWNTSVNDGETLFLNKLEEILL